MGRDWRIWFFGILEGVVGFLGCFEFIVLFVIIVLYEGKGL